MTAILGFIAEEHNEISMFLVSDGLVIWHPKEGNDVAQNEFEKIFRFNNFLISFNGEVSFYQTFLDTLKTLNKSISNISELQDEINKSFPFGKFGNQLGNSKAKYSNIIILDISNRTLAHHFAGNVSSNSGCFLPFDFQYLEPNKLYHFGSKVSFMNKATGQNEAFAIECNNLIKQTVDKQIEYFKLFLKEINEAYEGIGDLHSYYFTDKNGIEYFDKIES